MADIDLGLSFYAFILFALSMTLVVLHIDKRQLYLLLAELKKHIILKYEKVSIKLLKKIPKHML